MNSEQCCDVLELHVENVSQDQFGTGNPGGKYEKQGLQWNDKAVYYSTASEFYLYRSAMHQTWVVSVRS